MQIIQGSISDYAKFYLCYQDLTEQGDVKVFQISEDQNLRIRPCVKSGNGSCKHIPLVCYKNIFFIQFLKFLNIYFAQNEL